MGHRTVTKKSLHGASQRLFEDPVNGYSLAVKKRVGVRNRTVYYPMGYGSFMPGSQFGMKNEEPLNDEEIVEQPLPQATSAPPKTKLPSHKPEVATMEKPKSGAGKKSIAGQISKILKSGKSSKAMKEITGSGLKTL